MKILSLKSVLLYQLGRTLLGEAKANRIRFNDFLDPSKKSSSTLNTPSAQKLIDWYEIPLQKKPPKPPNASHILYVSALPQLLAASSWDSGGTDPSAPWQVAAHRLEKSRSNLKTKLTNKQRLCSPQIPSIETHLWLEFKIETQKAGWIAFSLTEKGLDKWLEHLCAQPGQSIAGQSKPGQSIAGQSIDRKQDRKNPLLSQPTASDRSTAGLLWQAQYTYACCHQLESTQPNSVSSALKDGWPEQADGDRRLGHTEQAWQSHSAKISLVHALIDTSDSLFWIPYQRPIQQYLLLLKRVAPLCQAFEHFYRACLCGSQQPCERSATPTFNRTAQQFRLIRATKNVLKVLLEGHLCERAPEKL